MTADGQQHTAAPSPAAMTALLADPGLGGCAMGDVPEVLFVCP